jgi:hypothetical protein
MFACFIAEWREWKRRKLGRSLAVSAGIIGLVAALSKAMPLALLWAYGAWALGFGWYHGMKCRRGASEWEGSLSDDVSRFDVAAGKILASGLVFITGAVFVIPPVIVMALVWAPPAGPFLLSAMSWFPVFVLGLGAGISTSSSPGDEGGFLGPIFLFVWFFGTIIVKPLNSMNPFIEAWLLLSGGGYPGAWICLGSITLFAAGFIALYLGAVGRPKKPRHA